MELVLYDRMEKDRGIDARQLLWRPSLERPEDVIREVGLTGPQNLRQNLTHEYFPSISGKGWGNRGCTAGVDLGANSTEGVTEQATVLKGTRGSPVSEVIFQKPPKVTLRRVNERKKGEEFIYWIPCLTLARHTCYGRIPASQPICWSPNSIYLGMWLFLETGSLKKW